MFRQDCPEPPLFLYFVPPWVWLLVVVVSLLDPDPAWTGLSRTVWKVTDGFTFPLLSVLAPVTPADAPTPTSST